MSLFGALSDLVGGVVLASAPVCDLALPPALLWDRRQFVQWLSIRPEIQHVRAIVDTLGRDMWTGVETRGLAQRDLERHVALTGEILAQFPPSAAALAEMASLIRQPATASNGQGEPVARRIAADIVARARSADAFTRHGVMAEIVQFLIERTFRHVIAGKGALAQLAASLAEYAAETAGQGRGAPAGLMALGISKKFAQCLEAAGAERYLADLAQQHDLSETALRRLVALVDSQTAPGDDQLAQLEHLAGWLADVRAQLLRPANDDVEIRRRRTAAAAALADGDFESAMEALRRIRRDLREARRKTEERLQEDALALKAQMLDEARATARLAELMNARGEYGQAAELFSEAAMALPRADRDQAWRFNILRANALLQQARQKSGTEMLAEALATYAQLVRQAAEGADTRALAEACLGHGDALVLSGERGGDATPLQDAVAMYQKAIQLLDREPEPVLLSRARLAYAKALAEIGERERTPEILARAAQAYRDAMKIAGIDKRPGAHADLRMGLGSMLVLLAMDDGEGAAEMLSEAADAYREALAVLDPEADTEQWGEAQFNLGLALLGLGEQGGVTAHLEQAVEAFKLAIDAMPRIRMPQRWALAQMNLGNALAALGERDGPDTARLQQAIDAYATALEELVRESDPLKWAITQMNLGSAYIRLGEIEDKRRNWLAAASALVPALEVFEQQRADNFAEMTRRSLKRFQDSWDSFIGLPKTSAPVTGAEPAVAPREAVRMAGNG